MDARLGDNNKISLNHSKGHFFGCSVHCPAINNPNHAQDAVGFPEALFRKTARLLGMVRPSARVALAESYHALCVK